MQKETNIPENTPGALVLAAGLSSRMEEFKPLIEIEGKTLLEHAVGLFEAAGIRRIVTVLGHRAEDLTPIIMNTSSQYVVNERYQQGMFASVQKGTEVLQHACEAFFLLPADIPFVRPTTILRLLEAYDTNPSPLIFYPQFQARRGHPPLIHSSLAKEILSYNGEAGMRGLLNRFTHQAVDIPVNDPFIRLDIDTPEDLLHMRKEMQNHLAD